MVPTQLLSMLGLRNYPCKAESRLRRREALHAEPKPRFSVFFPTVPIQVSPKPCRNWCPSHPDPDPCMLCYALAPGPQHTLRRHSDTGSAWVPSQALGNAALSHGLRGDALFDRESLQHRRILVYQCILTDMDTAVDDSQSTVEVIPSGKHVIADPMSTCLAVLAERSGRKTSILHALATVLLNNGLRNDDFLITASLPTCIWQENEV